MNSALKNNRFPVQVEVWVAAILFVQYEGVRSPRHAVVTPCQPTVMPAQRNLEPSARVYPESGFVWVRAMQM